MARAVATGKRAGASSSKLKAKLDLKKKFKELYMPRAGKVTLVDVPEMNFLMINGSGYPQTGPGPFQEAIEALYGLAYTLKFMLKKEGSKIDYTVMPLEGLWWMAGGGEFDAQRGQDWKWTLMVAQPGHITEEDVKKAKRELKEKKDPTSLAKVRFRKFTEGKSVQALHIGPWSEEQPTIERMHAFARENGFKIKGKHHEIYMSDPRRTAPEKLKTVLRQPVR